MTNLRVGVVLLDETSDVPEEVSPSRMKLSNQVFSSEQSSFDHMLLSSHIVRTI